MIRVDDSAWLAWGSALWYGTAVQLWTAHALAMLMRSYLVVRKPRPPLPPKSFSVSSEHLFAYVLTAAPTASAAA